MFEKGVSQGVMGYLKKWIVGETALGPMETRAHKTLYSGTSLCPDSGMGTWKKTFVQISAQQVSYSGTKCERTLIVTVFSI